MSELKRDLRPLYEALVIGVGGPGHSGKSVFLAALYDVMKLLRWLNFVFLIRGNPDGEGMWANESLKEVISEIRQKGKFTPEIVQSLLDQFVGAALMGTFRVIFVDLGGIRSPENEELLRHCTHFISLVRADKPHESDAWVHFAEAQGCQTLGVFASKQVKLSDDGETLDMSARSAIDTSVVPVTGELVNLDRPPTPPDCYESAVAELASWLVAFAER